MLDGRIGSGELLRYFAAYDVEVKVRHLDYGDCCWWGCGIDGPVKVGVERKGLADLVASMRSNRLSGFQLPGLLKTYTWIYLLVEGVYRAGEGGVVEIHTGGRGSRQWQALSLGSKPILYREVDHYLATLEHRCGVTVSWTANREQTVAWVVSRYKWWEKDWAKHDSFEAIYAPFEHAIPTRRGTLQLREAKPIELVAAQMPGVAKRAWEFRKRFRSARMLANAEVEELRQVEGIGAKGAEGIWKWWREGEQ